MDKALAIDIDSAVNDSDTTSHKPQTIKSPALPVLCIVVVLVGCLSVFNFFNKNNQSEFESVTADASKVLEGFVSSEAFENLQSSFVLFKDQLINLPREVGRVTDNIEVLDRSTKEGESMLSERLREMEKRLDKIRRDFAHLNNNPAKRSKEIVKIKKQITFDLDVDGMGSWGRVKFVTVLYNGQYLMIEQGQTLKGWTLIKLDADSRIATFGNKSGKRVNVNV